MLLITREIRAREAITAFDAFLFVAANFIVVFNTTKRLLHICMLIRTVQNDFRVLGGIQLALTLA